MRIFLSYASEDRTVAEEVNLALAGVGHDVFFDRDSLPAGAEYHNRIRAAIQASDVMVFLVSSASLSANSYTLTELKFAREKWPHPKGRLLPILIGEIDWDRIPRYLTAVAVLKPEGNAAAETLGAVSRMSLDWTGAGPAIEKVFENEVIYPADLSTTENATVAALEDLGRVTKSHQKERYVEGKVRYGLQSVTLRVSFVERDGSHTGIVIQGSSDDVWNAGGRSATKRLIETLTHLNTPGYRVDRLGMNPAALFGVICGFVLVLLFVMSLVMPRMFQFLGLSQ